MKTYNKTFLPDSIEYKGQTLTANHTISTSMILSHTSPERVIEALKSTGKIGVLVRVLPSSLKGKTDLHGKPYQPTNHIFTN